MRKARTKGTRLLAISLIIGTLFINSSPSSAIVPSQYVEGNDPAAILYDPTHVNKVELIVPPSSLQQIRDEWSVRTDPSNFSYVPATIRITTPTGVIGPMSIGIHLKGGWGSQRSIDDKAGFKIKINFTGHTTQRILGLKKMTFNNDVQDGSYTHEVNAYRVFRNVGVPAPRVGYVRIFMNCPATDWSPDPSTTCVDYGLHANIETMDEVALSRWISTTTHLYEGGTPTFPDATVDGMGGFQPADIGDDTNRSDLVKLAQVNQLDGAQWYAQMLKVTDLKEMTLDWAAEAFVGHWDGYSNNRNNFYLHSDSNGVFQMYPWGTDQTWGWINDLFSFHAAMPTKCMNYPPCRALYSQSLVKVWAVANKLNLPAMTVDIYSGILATDLGPQTDPFRSCNADCAFGNAENIYNTVKAESAYILPIATDMATTSPILSAVNKRALETLTWTNTNVPGVTVLRYETQVSPDNASWTTLSKTSTNKTLIKNLRTGTVRYYRVRVVTNLGTSPWSTAIRVRAL